MDRRFIQKVRRHDRIATRLITVGGMLVIASVIAILLLIIKVTLPLFMPAKAEGIQTIFAAPGAQSQPLLAAGVDNYQEVGFSLDNQGLFTFYDLKTNAVITTFGASDTLRTVRGLDRHDDTFTLLWQDGGVTLCQVAYTLTYDDNGKRTVVPELNNRKDLPPEALPAAPLRVVARGGGDGGDLTRVTLLADNRFNVTRQTTTRDLFDNETTETVSFLIDEELPGTITAFTLDRQGDVLYAGTDTGSLLRWKLDDGAATRTDNVVAVPNNQAITALALVFGDISAAVGGADGSLTTWMPVAPESNAADDKKLRAIHKLTGHSSPVDAIIPSRRSKSLVSLGRDGHVYFDHMTSENHLLDIDAALATIAISGQGNSLIGIDRRGALRLWNIDNPHPEINLKTLFGKIWYESYPEPDFTWQSSAGSDDFEAKFSLVPLLFGTLKGTLYAMVFALPLAIFGAVYTSQFASPRFKKTVKPVIEIMASVPSVVIGFLIALWLAPLVEKHLLATLLSLVVVPLVFLLFMLPMQPLCETPTIQHRMKGYEFILLVPVIILAGGLCFAAAPWLEDLFFRGDLKQWLYDVPGMRYDQRNCIIIAFGLGIAVIPLIFSITEDAISNIPPSLTAASLALGASRWQTIWRVVLPSASPGIFAAIMIGFGRAVGETMIVLMATGNTPIIDWSIFNGMRTLSANIAVEIPEAPQGGTLYRVLFLCATLLFMLTFILNTGAEIIRERLRKKYGRY